MPYDYFGVRGCAESDFPVIKDALPEGLGHVKVCHVVCKDRTTTLFEKSGLNLNFMMVYGAGLPCSYNLGEEDSRCYYYQWY